MKSITDGEFRRRSWHMDFICRIGGVVSAGTQVRPFHNEKGDVKNEIEAPTTLLGNLLTEDQQFAKLALVVEIAREVWGE